VEFSYQLTGEGKYQITSVKSRGTATLQAEAVDLSGFLQPQHRFSRQQELPFNRQAA